MARCYQQSRAGMCLANAPERIDHNALFRVVGAGRDNQWPIVVES